MKRPDKDSKIEHIKGRYSVLVALVAAIGAIVAGPYLCNKKAAADTTALKPTILVKSNQNSPVAAIPKNRKKKVDEHTAGILLPALS